MSPSCKSVPDQTFLIATGPVDYDLRPVQRSSSLPMTLLNTHVRSIQRTKQANSMNVIFERNCFDKFEQFFGTKPS